MKLSLKAVFLVRTSLVFVVLLLMNSGLQAQVDTVRVELGFDDQNLRTCLAEIKRQTGVAFAYDANSIEGVRVNVSQEKRSLAELLDLLLRDSGFSYKIFDQTIALIPMFSAQQPKFELEVIGQALNVKSGESLPFTTVAVKGTQNAAIANQDGRFTLDQVPSDTSTLVFSFIGYEPTEFRLNPDLDFQNLRVYLLPSTNSLPEARIVETEGNFVKIDPLPSVQSLSISTSKLAGNVGIADPIKALQLLPGVSSNSENEGGLIIRGSGSDQLLIIFDGFTVYHVDHFYGIFGAFNPESIKHMRLYRGAFEARLGDRNSGVLEITGKEGSRYSSRVSAGLNLLTADLNVELPVLSGKGSLVLSGRRSYTDVVPTFLFKDLFNTLYNSSILQGSSGQEDTFGNDREPTFSFYDLTARLTYDPGKNDHLNFTIYHGKDRLQFQYSDPNPDFGSELEFNDRSNWGNTGISGRWGHKWNSRNYTNAVLAYSNYSSSLDTRDVLTNTLIGQTDTLFTEQSSELQDRTLRVNHEITRPGHKISTGMWVTNRLINYDFKAISEGQIAFLEQQGNTVAVYAQDEFRVEENWLFNLGLRMSYNDLAEDLRGEPRLAAAFRPGSKFSPKVAVGWHHQDIRRIRRQNLFLNTPDVWRLSNLGSIPVLSSFQLSGGAQGAYDRLSWDVEFFYKESDGEILDPINLEVGQDNQFLIGDGQSYGVDIMGQFAWGNWRSQLAYTFSESILKFEGINQGDWIYSPFDQRHQFKGIQHYRKGNWDFSAVFIYSTGNNYTPALGLYNVELVSGVEESYAAFGIPFSSVLPAYHRLDLNASYKFDWQEAMCEAGISIFNAYNRNNLRSRSYSLTGSGENSVLATNNLQMIGFLPSINFRITWE